jgi:hypothetical protein
MEEEDMKKLRAHRLQDSLSNEQQRHSPLLGKEREKDS